jgi:hypothetical protein
MRLRYIIIAGAAFIFAITASSVISSFVNVLIPNPNKSDPAGKLEPDPQQKSKAEWLQQLEGGGPAETKETKTETKEDSSGNQSAQPAAQPAADPAPVFQQPNPAPQTPARVPPAPTVGPGNYDAPPAPPAPPVTSTGPGNM